MANEIEKTDGEALSKAESNDLNRRDLLNPAALMQEMLGTFFKDMGMEPMFETLDPFAELFSYNEDGSLNVTIEVPGIKESDLSVNIHDDGEVTVRGETKTATSSHSVEDVFTIPEGFSFEPTHHLENGILTLTFPLVKEESTESI